VKDPAVTATTTDRPAEPEPEPTPSPAHEPPKQARLLEPAIVRRAAGDAVRKLDPRVMARNPVMFIVELGSLLTTLLLLRDLGKEGEPHLFTGLVSAWLWFTVLFANFAEAWPRAAARRRRPTRCARPAARRSPGCASPTGTLEERPSPSLQRGDLCVVRPGELIPGDGEIVEGIASVDESAITGESAPVIRESGGDRSAVTGGTRVLSDGSSCRSPPKPGETFLDRMIALVEGAERQKTPNEIALSILLAGLTIIFLLAVVTLQPFAIYSGAPSSVVSSWSPCWSA
jgi:K+-transporting ATPase ATPase B chain